MQGPVEDSGTGGGTTGLASGWMPIIESMEAAGRHTARPFRQAIDRVFSEPPVRPRGFFSIPKENRDRLRDRDGASFRESSIGLPSTSVDEVSFGVESPANQSLFAGDEWQMQVAISLALAGVLPVSRDERRTIRKG